VAAGHLRGDPGAGEGGGAARDLLLVGSGSSLLAYDPHQNADAFNKEVSEGVSALLVANLDAAEGTSAGARAMSGAGVGKRSGADGDGDEGGSAGGVSSGAARTASALAVAGGNCSLQAFDGAGDEALWTVTGDEVTAMETVGTGGGTFGAARQRSLMVASADLEFRFFRGEDVQAEVIETAVATSLCRLDNPFVSMPPSGAAAGSAAS